MCAAAPFAHGKRPSTASTRLPRYAQAMTRSMRAWLRGASRGLRTARRAPAILLTFAAMAVVLAGCGGSDIPVVSFDPASACTTDGRQPGAYPDLEAILPKAYDGKAPANVDSGRNCTKVALGTLADAGVPGVRFAGATWALGSSSALTVAAFEGKGLDPAEMISFYEDTATTDRHTEKMSSADVTVGDKAGRRLDVLASDGTGQTIVAWPASRPDTVFVLLAADLGDAAVLDALGQFAGS